MRLRVVVLAACLSGLFAPFALSTTIVMPSDDQLIAKSPVILIGEVLQSNAVDENGAISTLTRIRVERTLKGAAPSVAVVREIGGRVDDRVNVVYGSPEYRTGERVLVFLWPTPGGEFRTMDLFAGKMTERRTTQQQAIWYRDEDQAGTHLLDADLQPVARRNLQRLSESFTSYVVDRAAGRAANPDYQIENPSLSREQTIQANFTMIAEPSIYRWFAFDNGGSVTWRSVGTQPGFAGGGVNEATAAMNFWNTAPGARISYVYGGVSSGTPAGLSTANGVNEVLFNDPLNEISGSYSPGTGGVIGRGGFNNVVSAASWTSGYAADPAHPAATYYNLGNIREGNLVIQDGISSSNFPVALLTAVISHEFGHTLGFGHSGDPSALMYASLSGAQNGSLQSDDQNAARWLYPGTPGSGTGGTSPPPPPATLPAAPSNLTAVVANGTQMHLNWQVNASNATAQAVYVAANSGAFENIGEVGATRNSAILNGLTQGATYRVRITAKNSAGESQPSNTAQVTVPAAAQNPTILPLGGTRFRVTLEALDQRTGKIGGGVSIPQNDLFGYFSIPALTGNAANPEVFVKMLDGNGVNGKFWVFYGGLTDMQYEIRVSDLYTGATRSYLKPAGSSCGGFDTSAFNAAVSAPITEQESEPVSLAGVQLVEVLEVADACTSSTGGLCVNASRFRVTLWARDQRSGKTGAGQALPQNDLFGYFSIPSITNNASNPEVFVKVLDGRGTNGRFWVFYGGLTDMEYTLSVTDTTTGAVRHYTKPAGSPCGGFDTAAF